MQGQLEKGRNFSNDKALFMCLDVGACFSASLLARQSDLKGIDFVTYLSYNKLLRDSIHCGSTKLSV